MPHATDTFDVRFIGDVHRKFDEYAKLLAGVPRSIQLGDMGVGFRFLKGPQKGELRPSLPNEAMAEGDHGFIRGNHDDPGACAAHPAWIPDGHIENSMMFVGGGFSQDHGRRLEGLDWWPDEELSQEQLDVMFEKYMLNKPRIMVTHEAPSSVGEELGRIRGYGRPDTRTSLTLQRMWSGHSPDLWVFAHWHVPFDHILNGTRMICLAELQHIDLNLHPQADLHAGPPTP